MKRIALTATAAVVALLIFAVPANASHVQCGDTITQTTTLDTDVVCPDDSKAPYGIVIGASDITLNLNGKAVRAGANRGVYGIYNDVAARVAVKNGRVEGFDYGVWMADATQLGRPAGADSAVFNLNVVGAVNAGIFIEVAPTATVSGNVYRCEQRYFASMCVFNNVVEMASDIFPGGGYGILAYGEGAQVWGNTIKGGAAHGIATNGDRSRTVFNKVESCNPVAGSYGVNAGGTQVHVWGNTVAPCSTNTGIFVVTNPPGNGGARIRHNAVSGNRIGMQVDDSGAIITDNTANENLGDGIVVNPSGVAPQQSLVRSNTANNNGGWGLFAPDAIDGGGNSATGNNVGGTGGNCTPNLVC